MINDIQLQIWDSEGYEAIDNEKTLSSIESFLEERIQASGKSDTLNVHAEVIHVCFLFFAPHRYGDQGNTDILKSERNRSWFPKHVKTLGSCSPNYGKSRCNDYF